MLQRFDTARIKEVFLLDFPLRALHLDVKLSSRKGAKPAKKN
jgi:hypothetical protein